MIELLLLVAGALIGVVADILFRQQFLRLGLRIRRLMARIFNRTDPLVEKPSQFRFGNVQTGLVSLYGNGEIPLRSRHLRTTLVEDYVELPKDLDSLRTEMRTILKHKQESGEGHIWNGEGFALQNYYPTRYGRFEELGLNFEFKLTDYAAFLAITQKADELGLVKDLAGNPTTIREKYCTNFDPEKPNHYLTHTFAIELAVLTRDHKTMLTQRSGLVIMEKNLHNVPVNETMQFPQDVDESGRPSFIKTAIRGLWEELGIDHQQLGSNGERIEFLTFHADPRWNDYAICGRIKLPMTAREIEQAYYERAKDRGMETHSDLFAVDFLPNALLEFVSQHRPWSPRGLMTLYYTMVREWGYWEIKSAMYRYPLKWNILADTNEA